MIEVDGSKRERWIEVLRKNDRGFATVPSPYLYPYRWLWDSALTAVGLATFDEERAIKELYASMSNQWNSGMVSHIDFRDRHDAYFPGPEFWNAPGNRRTSGITQPPVTATCALRIVERSADPDRALGAIRDLYPQMVAFHRWLYSVRVDEQTGLLACVHPWETGMDNSAAWDVALSHVPVGDLPSYERRDNKVVNPKQRPTDHVYDQYVSLVLELQRAGYDTLEAARNGSFRLADVGFNSLAVRASADLISLGQMLGESTSEIEGWLELGENALRLLWNEDLEMYSCFDLKGEHIVNVPTSAGFLPLLTRVPQARQVQSLIGVANRWARDAQYLLPSLDPQHPAFEVQRYWRGPVWINVNWFCAIGFAEHGQQEMSDRLRDDALKLGMSDGCWEYFDPLTGEPYGSNAFSWTAALCLDLCHCPA